MLDTTHISAAPVANDITPAEDLSVQAVCKRIAAALRQRSGKAWSVTKGRGTAGGWITIHAPPARREGGYMSEADRAELANLLGLRVVHHQGESIAASSDHRREYIQRAETGTATVFGKSYWD